ncbi:MAG: flagellar filament capping protein FliD [Acidobacteria bacterium]|nr:flagellar filament capping protein FliD [Acidobacteriota bacterium]
MGSPITFSGFNQIDFNLILNAVMEQEQAPLRSLETQKKTYETQNAAFGTLATRLGAVEAAATALSKAGSLSLVAATSSDTTAVDVSTSGGAVEGSYEVVVSQLAKSQVTASTSTYSSTSDIVATGGTLTVLATGQPPVDVPITGATSLEDIAAAINSAADSPVTASIVQAAPGTYRLVLTGRSSGSENAFTLTSTLTGGSGVAFTDTDGDNVYGDTAADNAVQAQDALLTVNNIPITSSSNTVTDVVPGATLSLRKADPGSTVFVGMSADASAVEGVINEFVTAYNALVDFVGEQRTSATAGKASIARDPLVRGLSRELREVLSAEYAGGDFTRLAEIGIEFTQQGKLQLNSSVFSAAVAANGEGVQSLFSQAAGSGAFGAITDRIADYTASGGVLGDVRQRLTESVSSLSSRMLRLEEQLAVRRAALQQEFTAADRLMSQLNNQRNSLSAIGASF